MIAEFIASWVFITIYVGALIVATVGVVFFAERKLRFEGAETEKLIRVLDSSDSAEQKLLMLHRLTDARIISHDRCRASGITAAERQAALRSILLSSAGLFLGCITSTPPIKHHVEGVRPAAGFLLTDIRSKLPNLNDAGDVIIRAALFGTFVGLIAALSIASDNIGVVQGGDEQQSTQVQSFLQELLTAASAKFWISAAGIACALVLRMWQHRIVNIARSIVDEVGLAFDIAFSKQENLREWCPRGIDGDQIVSPLREITDQIRSQPRDWVLSISTKKT